MARSGFGHSNPVFDRVPEFNRESGSGYGAQQAPSAAELQGMYDRPAAAPPQMQRMTLDDVVMKCAIVFGAMLVTAAASFFVLPAGLSAVLTFGGMIAGLVLYLVIAFKQSTNPALVLAFAVAEGLLVGGISRTYDTIAGYEGVVGQAILGTLAAFVGMLALYSSGKLRATPKFTKMLMTAAFGYLALALMSLVSSFFGVGDGWGFYGAGPLGILLSVAGVAIASFFLILDFDFIERGIRNGMPERYGWLAAAGLLMTLVWLYLEILRLLAILRSE